MTDPAMMVAPLAAWHETYGYELAEATAREAMAAGARGVTLTGGPLAATSSMLANLRDASGGAFFAAADLSGGTGELFPGGTALPPLGSLDPADLDGVRRAARISAREARNVGVTWALGPSCLLPANATSIARSRTFAGDDGVTAAACAEWLDACRAEGVAALPSPYPLMRPAMAEAALDSGVSGFVLAAEHAADESIIRYLRRDAAFDGIIAVQLCAAAEHHAIDEAELAVRCIAAGCDLLLGSDEPIAVIRGLRTAVSHGIVSAELVRESCARIEACAAWASFADPRDVTLDDALWARRVADAAVHVQRGSMPPMNAAVEVFVVDDDPSRPEPAGTAFCGTLAQLGVDVHREPPSGGTRIPIVALMIGDRRLALGFDTFSDGAIARVRDASARAERAARDFVLVHFTPPDYGRAFAGVPNVLCAWSGTRAMEEAAARRIARGAAAVSP